MTQNEKSKDIASQRMQLIAPLVVDGLDRAEIIKLRREISAKSGVSERSIIRYVEAYSNGGFQALFPKSKAKPNSSSVISEEILQEAILLRREVPNRSVSDIINILEWEGLVQPGILKRSTLQTHLMKRGYSSHHLKLYNDSQSKARRFQKQHRNQLWQSDIKYGPKLPIGPNGEKIALYMVAFIDDATRFVLHSEFYTRFDQTIVEDCFRKALAKFGAPEAVYFDNGKQYRNKQMIHICSELGVKLLYTRPYSPEAKGKVERLNREVDRFLDETKLERGVTLSRFNHLYASWLEESHQQKAHSSLPNNQSPATAFHSDSTPLKLLSNETIAHAFLYSEERKVDKSGCISFEGKKYEVGLTYIGRKVTIIYDPADKTQLTVEYEHHQPFTIEELVIPTQAAPRPSLPEQVGTTTSSNSRLLAQLEKKNETRNEIRRGILSFSSSNQGGN